MNTTTEPPHPDGGDASLAYVLIPFFIITVVGIVVAAVLYMKRRQRIDRLRHRLLPMYTYDPTEELNEAEQELWREDDMKGWTTTYQQRWPLLPKDPDV
ncbi:small integral membrane protein 29 [Clarias gariepinus]|uniref:small integral membrane protein 29 n=1 Tax=Clarias gariepinus TaxID=13013 RepID=UPI00234DAF40|nr:small integral membrane protein 29 [Clarias gariepinus]